MAPVCRSVSDESTAEHHESGAAHVGPRGSSERPVLLGRPTRPDHLGRLLLAVLVGTWDQVAALYPLTSLAAWASRWSGCLSWDRGPVSTTTTEYGPDGQVARKTERKVGGRRLRIEAGTRRPIPPRKQRR